MQEKFLPPHTEGVHIPVSLIPEENVFGHYIYFPEGYSEKIEKYPLIICMHGRGQIGNSQKYPEQINYILKDGPANMITRKIWNPGYPAIVVTPQCHENWWFPQKIHKFIEYIIKTYPIDINRIYLTGLSSGAFAVFAYVEAFGDENYAAAVIPVSGSGKPFRADRYKNTPIWAFHGEIDPMVPVNNSIEMFIAIGNSRPRVKPKLTIYKGLGHTDFDFTYEGTGKGRESRKFSPFDMDIYSWFYQFTKFPEKDI